MSRYRIEVHNGRQILCGGIIPADMVKPGQVWVSSNGHPVTVRSNDGAWVTYLWTAHDETVIYSKDNFSFQCRYCLETPEIPEELR